MRISDWSSDVCSSDLTAVGGSTFFGLISTEASGTGSAAFGNGAWATGGYATAICWNSWSSGESSTSLGESAFATADGATALGAGSDARSEEHTSELQSLMRSSYAVFCLKKKNKTEQRR